MTTTTSFRNRNLTTDQLDELILIALALRDQRGVDEELHPLPIARETTGLTGAVRRIARFEGWRVNDEAVDEAVDRLTRAGMIFTDRNPTGPGEDGCRAKLQAEGYARAAEVARDYIGGPLSAFKLDDIFTDNGFGQVEISFLGERIVIGCPEGEEDYAIRHAHRFEVDTGEVLKAVAGLDNTRAMLMAGVLAEERIAELESDRSLVPASDRVVGLDHNAPDYLTATAALERLIIIVRESNIYRETDPEDHDRRLAELEAGRRLLGSKWISVNTVKAALAGSLTYLALKFVDAPIGEAATIAWTAIKRLLNLPA